MSDELDTCCDVCLVVMLILAGLSALTYIIGNIILDIYVLVNFDPLYLSITKPPYYQDVQVELGLLVVIVGIFLIFILFLARPSSEDCTCCMIGPTLAYTGFGFVTGAFTIKALVDMNDTACFYQELSMYSYISDGNSHDIQAVLRRAYPYRSNVTDPFDIYQLGDDWVHTVCSQDYDKKAFISGFGFAGWGLFLISPIIGLALVLNWICCP